MGWCLYAIPLLISIPLRPAEPDYEGQVPLTSGAQNRSEEKVLRKWNGKTKAFFRFSFPN
jgi:hypothetical protein